MFDSSSQKSWIISIVTHVMVISILSLTWAKSIPKEETIIIPVKLALVKEKPKPKPKPKPIIKPKPLKKEQVAITNKAMPEAKQVELPTSLPGDRDQPEVVDKIAPVYPKQALNNDWEGTVKVEVFITASGKVKNIKIINSSGFDVLDQTFSRVIKQYYTFKPKRTMGEDVESSIIISHTFKLGDES